MRLAVVLTYVILTYGCSRPNSGAQQPQPAHPPVHYTPLPATDLGHGTPTTTIPNFPINIPSSQPTIPAPTIPDQNLCYKATPSICEAERMITQLTNQIRQQRGLNPVAHDERLSFVSRAWSEEQAQSRDISHIGFPRNRIALYQREFVGLRAPRMSAENVAMSFMRRNTNPGAVAAEFVQMWRTSTGHLNNMLGNHRSLGVGIAQARDGSLYATQIFSQ